MPEMTAFQISGFPEGQNARLMRSFEKGILIYFPDLRKAEFVKWDHVSKLQTIFLNRTSDHTLVELFLGPATARPKKLKPMEALIHETSPHPARGSA